jgi:hypothetical protein
MYKRLERVTHSIGRSVLHMRPLFHGDFKPFPFIVRVQQLQNTPELLSVVLLYRNHALGIKRILLSRKIVARYQPPFNFSQ